MSRSRKGNPYGLRPLLVSGVREAFQPNAVLELSSSGAGEVKILGLETNLYLAFNSDGQLYGEADEANEAVVFIEKTHGAHLVYLRSVKILSLGSEIR